MFTHSMVLKPTIFVTKSSNPEVLCLFFFQRGKKPIPLIRCCAQEYATSNYLSTTLTFWKGGKKETFNRPPPSPEYFHFLFVQF